MFLRDFESGNLSQQSLYHQIVDLRSHPQSMVQTDVCRCNAGAKDLAGEHRNHALSTANRRNFKRLAIGGKACLQVLLPK